ncbi:hypothetical protein Neosp_010469 [[Neocosmospora] mangrovei]
MSTTMRSAMALRGVYMRGSMLQRRAFASKASKPSVTSQFYRSFTRPIAKTLLLAVFTYQLVYWAWVKLETDEVRAERDGKPECCVKKAWVADSGSDDCSTRDNNQGA